MPPPSSIFAIPNTVFRFWLWKLPPSAFAQLWRGRSLSGGPQVESLNANHLAETACQSFEEEVQMRTKDILDECAAQSVPRVASSATSSTSRSSHSTTL